MKDLFRGSSAIQHVHMEKFGPGITAGLLARWWMKLSLAGREESFPFLYTITGIPVAVCMRCVPTHVMTVYLTQGTGNYQARWTPAAGEHLWTQHWCGIPVCCKYLSAGWDQDAAAELIMNRCAKLLLNRRHWVRLELQHIQVYHQ